MLLGLVHNLKNEFADNSLDFVKLLEFRRFLAAASGVDGVCGLLICMVDAHVFDSMQYALQERLQTTFLCTISSNDVQRSIRMTPGSMEEYVCLEELTDCLLLCVRSASCVCM